MKYLITSALPYINGIKHLGNLIGSLLPADIYCRYLKQRGHQVVYISGTDEHGTPAELAALEKGLPVAEFCERMYETQRSIYRNFHIDFSYFGRSSSPMNHSMTQEVFLDLWNNGFIEEQVIPSFYSRVDARYLPDRYIEGTCPSCGFEKARGDQCDSCGSLLDPSELIRPYSVLSGDRELELRQEKHLFLDLEKLQPELENWLRSKTTWSRLVRGIADSWLAEGLKKRCISRDLNWGVKIPLPGYEHKVFYVWFDAPLAYIAISKEWAASSNEDWQTWWKNPETELVQFMAKDNVPFHAVFWPGMMLGTRAGWQLPSQIKSFSWLNYEKGKFSTSQKRGIFTDEALKLFPADYWRYGLTAMAPESTDSDFSFQEFADLINKDLADKLGNFINRVLTFTISKLDGTLTSDCLHTNKDLRSKIQVILSAYDHNMNELKFRAFIGSLRDAWALGNEYFTACEPWKVIKHDQRAAAQLLGDCLYLTGLFAVMAFPVIPDSSRKIWMNLGFTRDIQTLDPSLFTEFWSELHGIQLAPKNEILFQKISPEEVEKLTHAYRGQPSAS